MRSNPLSLYFDMLRLAVDANAVIGLRMMRLSMGGASSMREAELMITEKLQNASLLAVENAFALGMGGSLQQISRSSLARTHKVVRANKRRLQRR